MAKDGLNIRLEGGAYLDRVLSKMAVTQQSDASKIVKASLSGAATQAKKTIANGVPKANKDTKGFKTASRNVTKGQLRNSLKSGLRNNVKVGRDVFLAGVWFNEGQSKNKDGSATKKKDDGFFAKFLYDNPHKDNAFGFSGGRNLSRAVKPAVGKFRTTMGTQLAKRIAAFNQAKLK